jgi:peptide/nickel transport system permease protein
MASSIRGSGMDELGVTRIAVARERGLAPGGRLREVLFANPLARLALVVLVVLHTVAIFAPWIASDRPFVLRAIDRGGYEAALRTLSAVAASAGRILERSDPPEEKRRQLEVEHRAALERSAKLEGVLTPADRASLVSYRELFESMLAAEDRGDHARALELAGKTEARARELRAELASADPAHPERGGKSLAAERSFPFLASLSGLEVFAMLAWIWLVVGPLRAVLFRRDPGKPIARARTTLVVLVLAGALAVIWEWKRPTAAGPLEASPYKAALDAGELVPRARPLFAPLPYGYAETHALEGYSPPSWTASARAESRPPGYPGARARAGEPGLDSRWRFLAGTDELGRDLLTRMIWGARTSLAIGLSSALLLTLLGVVFGALAGYFGGWTDVIVLRTIEILQSIPALVLVLFAMAFTDPRIVPPAIAIVLLIALVRWTTAARLVRAEFLRLREREFVLAARGLGYSPARTILVHVLPNTLGPILVHAAFAVSAGILTESAISFLGLGVQYPEASWGALVGQARNPAQWWIQLFPGLLIFATVTCYNVVGDAVREALDPRARG